MDHVVFLQLEKLETDKVENILDAFDNASHRIGQGVDYGFAGESREELLHRYC